MTSWTTSALVILVGMSVGPHGLNLLSPSVLLLLDPVIAMALAMLGVCVGLGIGPRGPRLTTPAMLAIVAGIAMAVLRQSDGVALTLSTLGLAVVAVVIACAGWLLVGQADSEREQQVFVAGCLLLIGGSATYASMSSVFAGLFAGMMLNAGGRLARARFVQHLEYFQHPLFVVMLLAAGASLTLSREALAVIIVVAAFHAAGRGVADPFPVSAGLAAIAVALDIFRGAVR